MSKGTAGYKNGGTNYLLSFAGYFPADAPRYSCIVCIQKSGLPASGGGMSGVVFHDIAEGIMAQSLKLDVTDARDSTSVLVPDVKNGNILAADYVLSHLGISTNKNWGGSYTEGNPIWGCAEKKGGKYVSLERKQIQGSKYVPDVTGMGARDAVYLLESRGVKVTVIGRGKVIKQSLEPGHFIKRGERCQISLK
jgi:cell division protein FtsI (penicillin-binding protein 3)